MKNLSLAEYHEIAISQAFLCFAVKLAAQEKTVG